MYWVMGYCTLLCTRAFLMIDHDTCLCLPHPSPSETTTRASASPTPFSRACHKKPSPSLFLHCIEQLNSTQPPTFPPPIFTFSFLFSHMPPHHIMVDCMYYIELLATFIGALGVFYFFFLKY
jgi:hypothetical protein